MSFLLPDDGEYIVAHANQLLRELANRKMD